MNTIFSAAMLVTGLSESASWDPVIEAGNQHWIITQSVSEQRDMHLGSINFTEARRYYVASRTNVFWMTPTWTDDIDSLPDTKPGEDLGFVMAQRHDESCILLLPLPSPSQRGRLYLENGLQAGLRSDQSNESPSAPTFLLAHGTDPIALLASSIKVARQHLSTFRLRKEKPEPAFIDSLGWCTWDAYYRDVTAEGIEDGFARFKQDGHTPGFLIIDDGWQDVSENWGLRSFGTNTERFPEGLGELSKTLRERYELDWIGVWHTLQGYWGGIDPEGPLADRYPTETTLGKMEVFSGWPEQYAIEKRVHVSRERISDFFHDFYRELSQQGINLVKVDNQAQLELFSRRQDLPENAIRDSYHKALQGAAAARMEGNLLHCMSQASEIYFQLSSGNLVRNSDDFYPKKDEAAQISHIVQNAFNAAFTGNFCVPDWDMFQTYHRNAMIHAIGRVISGGPIYISDKPEMTDHSLLDKLVVEKNRILRFAQPGKPIARQFFQDPRLSDELLIVANQHKGGFGAVAFFNCHENEERSGNVTIAEITNSKANKYVVYDYMNDSLQYIEFEDSLSTKLPPAQAGLFSIAPVHAKSACLGLAGKLNGIAAIESATQVNSTSAVYRLRASGDILFAAESMPKSVLANGQDVTLSSALRGRGFMVSVETKGEVELVVSFD